MNPLQLLQSFIGKGMSPQQIIGQMMSNKNPMITNLISMAQKGDAKGVENFARNMFKEKGRDFDKEFNDFKNNFKKG
ncbi:MAG: hypothetical protein K2P14_05215 [Anaeroplasmataceae bacterium]|nr:hypothetical protein [Anaeroplasmataceae bacterium]